MLRNRTASCYEPATIMRLLMTLWEECVYMDIAVSRVWVAAGNNLPYIHIFTILISQFNSYGIDYSKLLLRTLRL
jgi:hypothetical protein